MYHVKCKLPVFVHGALFKLCLNIYETELKEPWEQTQNNKLWCMD